MTRTAKSAESVNTFCRLCEAGCGMVATVEDLSLIHI